MLTKRDISRLFSSVTYHIGETLVPQIRNYEEEEDIQFPNFVNLYGEISGETCTITINKMDYRAARGNCTCMDFSIYHICPHCAALMLAHLEYTTNPHPSFTVTKKREASTSPELTQFMNSIPFKSSADSILGTIELEPHLDVFEHGSSLMLRAEFKIKKTGGKAYVIRKIDDLLTSIENHEKYRYGKGLEFIHSISAFTPAVQPLVRFLQKLSQENDRYAGAEEYDRDSFYYRYYVSERVSLPRQLTLSGRYLDEFMAACKDIPLYMDTRNRKETVVLSRVEQEPPLKTKITRSGKGFTFAISSLNLVLGERYGYTFSPSTKSYHVFPVDSENLRQMYTFARDNGGQANYISSADLQEFTEKVYPILSTHTVVRSSDFDPYDYLPEVPSFTIYLDYPQKNTITCDAHAVYSHGKYSLFEESGPDVIRNHTEEEELHSFLLQYFNAYNPNTKKMVLSGTDDAVYDFVTQGIPALQEKANVFVSEELKKLNVYSFPKMNIGISVSKTNLLQLDITPETMTREEVAEIMSKYQKKKKYYRLRTGEFVNLADSEAFETFSLLAEELQLKKDDILNGEIELPLYRSLQLNSLSEEEGYSMETDDHFRSIIKDVEEINTSAYQVPAELDKIMRDYQKDGFRWLSALKEHHFGALLADEMGLGKTIQVLSLINAQKTPGKTLVICPASLVFNWYSEVKKFTPHLKAVMLTGTPDMRKDILNNHFADFDIFITSYTLAQKDTELYDDLHFDNEVIDEAQYIKNAFTYSARAVKKVHADFRIALTGTPIENKLSELWSIFDYILPGFFHSYQYFKSHYEQPVVRDEDEVVRNRLNEMIAPFILRRLKKDVLKDLPEKLEEVYYASMEDEQRSLYEARVQMMKIMLSEKSEEEVRTGKIEILAQLTRLRQVCCDPGLIYENYSGGSAKQDLCIDLIQNAIDGGHKILLFSQFTSMLEILTAKLTEKKIAYHLLTGSTPKAQRAKMTQDFQEDNVPVFCISLKAGGTGLNLTAADIVIHYDPWWNPAVENQASDRAHRIGQKNIVTVYRLIAKDTIEERILELQKSKADLAGKLLDGEGISSASLTKEDLLNLLD